MSSENDRKPGLGSSDCYPTPGPWSAGKYKGMDVVFWDKGNGTVPIAIIEDWAARGSYEANAKLMAAAPDMFEALVLLVDAINNPDNMCGAIVNQAEAAMKKALGG